MKNYKIKPELRDFILQKAKEQPGPGCRKISWLIQEQFQLNISKSSISAILKSEGLNKTAGRPRTRPFPESSLRANEVVSRSPERSEGEAIPTEIASSPSAPRNDRLEIPPATDQLATEILSLKFILENQTIFYLDAGFQSIWPTNHIPQTFSRGLVRLKGELERVILFNHQPLVLLAAPGFQAPASTFLDFLVCFKGDDSHKALKCIELYTRDGELLEVIQPIPIQKRHFLIGLWPWQYKKAACPLFLRKVVWQRDSREILTVLTNMDEALAKDDEIIELYLRRWPEPQESYQEFLNKITASLSLGKDFPRK